MRELALIQGSEIVNVIVIPDGKTGDAVTTAYAKKYDHVARIDQLDPKPGLGVGWTYIDGQLVPPPVPEPEPQPEPEV